MNKNLLRRVRVAKSLCALALSGGVIAVPLGSLAAPTVEILHSFGEAGPDNSKLLQAADGNLYGTTISGGTATNGSIFQFVPGGTGNTIYSFTNGADGSNPECSLSQATDGFLYGTARFGGASSNGTIYRVSTNGAFQLLYTFTNGLDGANPRSGLLLASDGNFYGTAINGGSKASGTIFRVTTNGTLTVMHSFTGGNDGANPHTSLIQGKDGGLYGTTFTAGSGGSGTVFRMTLNAVFSSHYSFTGGTDGATPDGTLCQGSDGFIYGTTIGGGTADWGTVFKIATNGTTITTLYSFTNGTDGAEPLAGLLQTPNGLLYGSTEFGALYSDGGLYIISTNGNFTNIYSFTGGTDGNQPFGEM